MPAPGLAHADPSKASAAGGIGFADAGLFAWLEAATNEQLDGLAFGVIAMTGYGTIAWYNAAEAKLTGLTPARVVGRHFFTSVAPCTNNYMIAQRFDSEPEIDATVDYVFTFRLAPTRVRLRLLKRPDGRRMYLAVQRRD